MTSPPAAPPATVEHRPRSRGTPARSLRIISLFKWLQSLLITSGALTALHLLRPSVTANLRAWIGQLPYEAQERLTARTLSALLNLPRGHARLFVAAAFGYALLFAVEGAGLWLGRRWAEWLTVIATGSLVPFELWEILRRPSVAKLLLVILNVAVVWYLSYRLKHPPHPE